MQETTHDGDEYVPFRPRVVSMKSGYPSYNLTDVFRDVLKLLMERNGWNQSDAGERLGVGQSTAHRILKTGADTTIQSLTKICAHLGETPIGFFAMHPVYSDSEQSDFEKDMILRGYKERLSSGELRGLLALVSAAKEKGVLDQGFAALNTCVEAARRALEYERQVDLAVRRAILSSKPESE